MWQISLLCFVLQSIVGIPELCWRDHLHRKWRDSSAAFVVLWNCLWIDVPLPKRYALRFTWFSFQNSCLMNILTLSCWLLTSVLWVYFAHFFLNNFLFVYGSMCVELNYFVLVFTDTTVKIMHSILTLIYIPVFWRWGTCIIVCAVAWTCYVITSSKNYRMWLLLPLLLIPGRAKYCDQPVCMSVCFSVCLYVYLSSRISQMPYV